MADFAIWAAAAMPSFGFTAAQFLDAYAANRRDANSLTLEASAIAKHVIAVSCKAWTGTASELLDILNGRATDDEKRRRNWPKGPKPLSDALRRIAANLRAEGIFVDFLRTGACREIVIDRVRNDELTFSPEVSDAAN